MRLLQQVPPQKKRRCLKADFEERLALARCVVLANIAAVDDAKVRAIDVVRAIGVRATYPHSIEDVREFHPQLRSDPFTKVEVLRQREILVAVEGTAQASDVARCVAHREVPRGREGRKIEDRQAFVIIVVVHVDGLPGDIRDVAGSKRTAVSTDSQRSAARILENTTDLPPTKQVLRRQAPLVQHTLAGTNGQLVDA